MLDLNLLIIFYLLFAYSYIVIFIFIVICLYFTLIEEKFYVFEWRLINLSVLFDIKLYFYFDYISNLFIIVVRLISRIVFYYRNSYIKREKNEIKFIFFTFLFVFSMYILVLSLNVIIILLGWDGLGLVSYFLVIYYNSDNRHYSGVITIMINRVGDIGIIFMIFLLINNNFDIIILNINYGNINIIILVICLSAFTKRAQFPFNSWLPLAIAAPTPISSLVHSSTLVTAGVYLLIRFNRLFKNNSYFLMNILLLVGLTIILSGFRAMTDCDIKKIIAYSTLSQLSLMLVVVILGNELLGFFHILTHAMFKSLIFLCSGVFIHECFDNQDIRYYRNLLKSNIFIVRVFYISRLSLIGFPFLRGFYSKDLILEIFYRINFNGFYVIMVILMTSFTTFYSLRLIKFSILIRSNSFKIGFILEWSSLYSGLIILFFGVIFMGSGLNWLIVDKLDLYVFNSSIKSINLFLIFLGLSFFKFFEGINLNFYFYNIFVSIFYLPSLQGLISNKIFINSVYFYVHIEYYFDYLISNKFKIYLRGFIDLLRLFKFLNYLLLFMFIMVYYIYIYRFVILS